MSTPISRMQAYAKLVVLMGDHGLPAPERMAVGQESAGITLATAEAFEAWTTALNAENTRPAGPFIARDGWRVYGSHVEDWYGRPVSIGAQVPPSAEPEPITEDMTRVREIAGAPADCEHPWHSTSTPDHEPVESTCPACGDHAYAGAVSE